MTTCSLVYLWSASSKLYYLYEHFDPLSLLLLVSHVSLAFFFCGQNSSSHIVCKLIQSTSYRLYTSMKYL